MTLDVFSIIAIISSAGSYLRAVVPKDKPIELGFLKIAGERHAFYEGIATGFITTIFWSLTYHSQRIDISSPEGFLLLINSLFSGPFFIIGWCLNESKREEISGAWLALYQPRQTKLPRTVLITIIIISIVVGGVGYSTGLIRPYEDCVVIAKLSGLNDHEQIRLKDGLQVNLERLEEVLEATPKYYSEEVYDTDSAEEAAFNTNQRFVAWGSVYFEERLGTLSADVLIRVRDASEHINTYHPKDYSVKGTTRSEVIDRITNDLTVATIWALGLAKAGRYPSSDSALKATQILGLLSSEDVHDYVPYTKNLGFLLMDWGYEMLWQRLKKGTSLQDMGEIYEEAISELEQKSSEFRGLEPALARLHSYCAAALLGSAGADENIRKASEHMDKAIELDPKYPMPYYHLTWYKLGIQDQEEAVRNGCEFINKMERAYGDLTEYAKEIFDNQINEVNDWIGRFDPDCNHQE